MNRNTLGKIMNITSFIDMHIESKRIRLGVDPNGIKSSKFIIYYTDDESFISAVDKCFNLVVTERED